ncbi:15555_t:CDS:2, partial [Dentiscutata erythropus]
LFASVENILHLIYESSDDGIENKYSGIENNIEGELGIEYEKDTEDKPGTESEKDTEDEPGIELEEDIDIVSESDDASENTNNYQRRHLPLIRIKIYCGKTFGAWEECQEALEHYARQNNFVIRKKHIDNSRNPCQRTWDCERSGKYVSRKTAPPEKQRNKGSKRIGCPFLVNACKSKGPNNETIIKLTSMNLEHNYLLVPENASFATSYRKLTTEMKKLIENYVLCNIDVSSQIRLLCGLFPEATIVDYDVKNYMYKFRRTHDIQECDTAKLFQHFEKERTKNPDWYVQSLIDPELNRLQGVFYMTPEQCKLWRRYADIILNDNTVATNIYKLPLCIFAVIDNNFKSQIVAQTILPDETRVQPGAFMIDADPGLESVVPEIYPDTYLLHCIWHIGHNIEKQLVKLLGDHYTDFIKAFYQSTEYLLRQLDPHKTTWAKAFTEEQFASRFAAWHEKTSLYMIPSVTGRLFPDIYNILHNKKINFEDPYNLTLEVVDNGPIEFEYDFRQIRFNELLERIDHSLVAEVWEVRLIEHKSNVGQNFEKAYFHISLIPRRWYKDEFMDAVVVDEPFLRRKSLEKNTAAKAIGRKQLIKGTLLGLACKCVEELDNNQIVESDQGTESNQDTESDQDTENDQHIENNQDIENDQDIETI